MIAAPAVDVRGGRCVQLVGGRPDDERVSLPDPVAVAEGWWDAGFGVLHVVDLDAALGSGDNLEQVERVLAATPAETQVGGGVRDDERAARLLEAGADRLIVGTRALRDPEWLARLAARHPERVMVALDTVRGRVVVDGWATETGAELEACLAELGDLPLAGILTTDVGREGRMEGVDRSGTAHAVGSSAHPVWISGGIAALDDLEHVAEAGAAGAVLGMALYTGTIDVNEVARRWGAREEERA